VFNRILVPTDLTERSLKALEVAVRMALHDGSRISLLHVIETIDDAEFEDFQDFYRKLEKHARKLMEDMAGKHGDERVLIERDIIYGKRVREIVRFAEKQAIDLIILSSHPVEKEAGLQAWGTISYKVGILSNCPVMLVK
jgi:nucleotide-binding universal stress UspA family protein